jgi:putative tryptophan/tyrosine transport system substrate-binding protein
MGVNVIGVARRASDRVMGRRAFIAATLAGIGTAVAAPRASAQPAPEANRIGWLSPAAAETGAPNLDALRQGLRELGYQEGRNLTIEARWADGASERLPALARELVSLRVDVICTAGTQASRAAREATSTIPVVFANVAFPVQQQLVVSYARPGGNVTGVAFIGPEYGKRLELLKEVVPRLSRVALVYNPENQGSVLALEETKRWAQSLGVALEPHRLRGPHDIEGTFAAVARSRPDAIMTTADPLIASYRARIVAFATKHRFVSMFPGKEYVDAGGLMFYGGSIPEMYRRAAVYVDRIRKGAKPSGLPVEQPIKFDMIINMKTARALGLTIPPSLLLRADEVIE